MGAPTDIQQAAERIRQKRKQKSPQGTGEKTSFSDSSRLPQSAQIVALIVGNPDATLWHDSEGEGYISMRVADHTEHTPLKSRQLWQYVAGQYYEANGRPPNSSALKDALAVLEYEANRGENYETFIRVAAANGHIYVDLGDATWQAVEITPQGWQIVNNAPIKFLRTKHMLPLPEPQRGGTINQLRPLMNTDNTGFELIVGFLLKCLNPAGADPILMVNGEQGSGKTFQSKQLKRLIDPHVAETRSTPRESKDLYVAARSSWLLAYDNLSFISGELSDAFCGLSTGSAIAGRKLFTDSEEAISKAKRPVIMNGISDIGAMADFMDRVVTVTFNRIEDEARKPEKELEYEFDRIRPLVLGALYDTVSRGLANFNHVKIDRLPRLADFAQWVTACEPESERGSFVQLLFENREQVRGDALSNDPVGQAVVGLMANCAEWKGTANDLLNLIDKLPDIPHGKHWPTDARSTSVKMKRIKPLLYTMGIVIDEKRTSKERTIFITKLPSLSS